MKVAFEHIHCIANVLSARRCTSFGLDEIHFIVFHQRYCVFYWIHFRVLIVKQLSDYFVVILQVINEFSSLESWLGNLIIEATIQTAQ